MKKMENGKNGKWKMENGKMKWKPHERIFFTY
jgi:hypothetical protein